MSSNLSAVIDAFADLRVLVLGEAMLDSYFRGDSGRLSPEAPVPVINLSHREDVPGGAANTAANAAALGARVMLLSTVGDDDESKYLRKSLRDRGITDDGFVVQPGRRTLAKHRVCAGGQLLVRFDAGDTGAIDFPTERQLIDRLADRYPQCDAVIISDYGYGVLTQRVRQALAVWQQRSPRLLLADAKDLAAYRDLNVTAVKPNYAQAASLLGISESDERPRAERVLASGEQLLDLTGARIVAVTLDRDGAALLERGKPPYRTFARASRPQQVAGAGDTFISAFGLALAAGAEAPVAAEIASAAAAVVVSKVGTAVCTADELRGLVGGDDKYFPAVERLATRLELLRRQGRRVVFTNGCFDILHRGHVTYLTRAKALGDVLVVGVNTDAGIRRLKGPDRPINTLDDRLQVLGALSCVDYLVAFDEETPCNLVRALRPDVFVKGGDYTRERLPEAPLVEALGGVVQILPFVQDRSTTRLIERIRDTGLRPAADDGVSLQRG